MQVVVLGAGFTGCAFVELALQAGAQVVATTRDPERGRWLESRGARALVSPRLEAAAVAPHLSSESRVLVTFPPDLPTDAELARAMPAGARCVYISSTAVYGAHTGQVDETTPVQPNTSRGERRLQAEQIWREARAVVVRAPAIYGPGRGLHLRIARGALKLGGDPTNTISRIHRDDLAKALFELLCHEHDLQGSAFLIGDLEPAPHIQVVAWLCERLGVPVPKPDPNTTVDDTLSSDRRVDSRRLRTTLNLQLAYPTYREGLSHCMQIDRAELDRYLAGL